MPAGPLICVVASVAAFYASAKGLQDGDPVPVIAITGTAANIAGIAAPLITGVVVDQTGSFTAAFVIAAALGMIGIAAFGFVVRRIEPIDWNVTEPARPASALRYQAL